MGIIPITINGRGRGIEERYGEGQGKGVLPSGTCTGGASWWTVSVVLSIHLSTSISGKDEKIKSINYAL